MRNQAEQKHHASSVFTVVAIIVASLLLLGGFGAMLVLVGLQWNDVRAKPPTVSATLLVESNTAVPGESLLATHAQLLVSSHIVEKAVTDAQFVAEADKKLFAREVIRGLDVAAIEPHILEVQLTYGDPVQAELILTAVVDTFVDFIEQSQQSLGSETVKLISQAQTKLEQELQQQQDELLERQAENDDPNGQEPIEPRRSLEQIENELRRMQAQRDVLESRLAEIDQTPKPSVQVKVISLPSNANY